MPADDDTHPSVVIDPSRRLLWKLGVRDVVGPLALAAAAGTVYAGLRLELSDIRAALKTKGEIDERQTVVLDKLSDAVSALNLNISELRGELRGRGVIGDGR